MTSLKTRQTNISKTDLSKINKFVQRKICNAVKPLRVGNVIFKNIGQAEYLRKFPF